MHDEIFLSYSNQDRAAAKRLAGALEDRGLGVWWDKEIPPGKTFDQVIEERLDAAKAVVVLWSARSVESQWVRTEAGEAMGRGILVPVLIEDCKIPLAFRRIEAAQLGGWEGDTEDQEFRQLVAALRSVTGSAPPARAAGAPAPAPPAPAAPPAEIVDLTAPAAAPAEMVDLTTEGAKRRLPRSVLWIGGIALLLVLAFVGRQVFRAKGVKVAPGKTEAVEAIRMPDRLIGFVHSEGTFEKMSKDGQTVWRERHQKRGSYDFVELRRDATWIVARDDSRKCSIRLPVAGGWCELKQDGKREWSKLYEIKPRYR